jgi:hypothetical protein
MPALFNWLMGQISFQGISDRVAAGYLRKHGSITWKQINRSLRHPSCPKLESYWHFHRCGYVKSKRRCSCPEHFKRCPVPRAPLRNGRLNQSAYSLFLFIRDIADGDLIGWIDKALSNGSVATSSGVHVTATPIVAAMRGIFGVADKVLTMALANLFLAAGPSRKKWQMAGANLVVIDTLVHNWLGRTGLVSNHGRRHAFGPDCYSAQGCASVVKWLAHDIDATSYSRFYPRYFPRFVQHAIWRFCAQDLNVCNGNRIDDRSRCRDRHCILFRGCARRKLTT